MQQGQEVGSLAGGALGISSAGEDKLDGILFTPLIFFLLLIFVF
jgi:hypothetical protein